ncbi:MAG: hypothetical protein JRH10_02645 [Deltaproteobacteria bacterium]|nr:hypothetical protein [Deltaproteobacteria bacterium]MBW2447837.1 hypothetical protein [Deltaproteobacteria bacterium]
MSLWMALALVQAVALPGYLLTRALGLDGEGALRTALRSFAFTLVVNHFLALGLVVAGAHGRPAWLVIFALELAVGGVLLRRRPEPAGPRPRVTAQFAEFVEGGPTHRPWLLAFAFGCLAYLASSVPQAFSHVFSEWDAVLSWNRWALSWADGLLPVWVAHYPQLLPLNGSILYVLQGEPLQFLHHGVLALFEVGVGLVLLDLGLSTRRDEPILAIPLLTLLLGTGFGQWLGAGYADIPVAFYGLLALSPLLAGPFGDDARRDRARLVACTLGAIGAALTKQPGLYVAGLLPGFVWLALAGRPMRERIVTAGAVGAVTLAAILPWYGYAELRVLEGFEPTEMPRLDQVIEADGFVARAVAALAIWKAALPAGLLYPILLLVLASLARPPIRWVTLGVSLPFPVLWSYVASYDLRNSALALPFVSLSAAYGATWLASSIGSRIPTHLRRLALAAATAGLAVWTFHVLVDADAVRRAHDEQLAEVGWPPLNERILAFEAREGFSGQILSNYLVGRNLPPLRDRFFEDRSVGGDQFWPFRSAKAFRRILDDPANDIRFILVQRPIYSQGIKRMLLKSIRSGEYEVVFETTYSFLLRVPALQADEALEESTQ